jgi:hypothetical protein
MQTIKIKKKIKSNTIKIKELDQFIGQEVEIVITPSKIEKEKRKKLLLNLAGTLKSGKDPLQFQKEIREEWKKRN